MMQPNSIQRQLEKLGIKSMIPTEKLLTQVLGGMTLRRFNKILGNSSVRELTLSEARRLTAWLAALTHQPESAIDLWEVAPTTEAALEPSSVGTQEEVRNG